MLGTDIDRQRVDELSSGRPPVYEPGLGARVRAGLKADRLRFLHRDDVTEPLGQAALVATGTPLAATGGADLEQVKSALEWIRQAGSRGLVVAMKSTVPPGTGRRLMGGMLAGSGVDYVSNPEFLREGHGVRDWDFPDRIVIGADPGDARPVDLVQRLYANSSAPRLVTDITSAEMIKYASNAFLATRISFINEVANLCEGVGASIDAVSEGLGMDPRTGARIHAGVGYGGSCFPKDIRALDHLASTTGVNMDLLRAVVNVNNRQRLLPLDALRQRFDGSLAGLSVGILGLAFKPGTDDVREAPSLDLARDLVEEGVEVRAFDPRAMASARPKLPSSVRLVSDVAEAAEQAHALVLLTEWGEIVDADWPNLAGLMLPPRFLFDGRNALDPIGLNNWGFQYLGVGRNGIDTGHPAYRSGQRRSGNPGAVKDDDA